MNAFEMVARAKKVAKLVAAVPAPETRSQAERLAMTLAGFTERQRAMWAQAAGVRAPSNLTWAWVVSAVREARV
jgi:hypothetical protein